MFQFDPLTDEEDIPNKYRIVPELESYDLLDNWPVKYATKGDKESYRTRMDAIKAHNVEVESMLKAANKALPESINNELQAKLLEIACPRRFYHFF